MSLLLLQSRHFWQLDISLFSKRIQPLFWPNLVHSDFALFANSDTAALLLEQKEWEEMLRNFYKESTTDKEPTTPLRALIAFMPGKLNHC